MLQVLEFEPLDERGAIKRTWLEYLYSALPRVNERHAKHIVLYLCKHKDRRVSRRELMTALQHSGTDHGRHWVRLFTQRLRGAGPRHSAQQSHYLQ